MSVCVILYSVHYMHTHALAGSSVINTHSLLPQAAMPLDEGGEGLQGNGRYNRDYKGRNTHTHTHTLHIASGDRDTPPSISEVLGRDLLCVATTNRIAEALS